MTLTDLNRKEQNPQRPWGRPIITNILDNILIDEGSVEFDIQLIEKEVPAPAFAVEKKIEKK